MVLNDREKIVAWVVGGLVGAAGLYFLADSFYFGRVKTLEDRRIKEEKANQEALDTIRKAHQSYDRWTAINLPTRSDIVETPARNRIFDIAQLNGFQISNFNNTNARVMPKQADFKEVEINASMDTTTSRLGRFLLTFEAQRDLATPLAMRLEDLSISSKKDGQDDLHVEMKIRALIYDPKDTKLVSIKPPALPTGAGSAEPGTRPAVAAGRGASGVSVATAIPPQPTISIMNIPLGSLDPGVSTDASIPMEERLKARREDQLAGKPMPKPRFGEAPLDTLPGETLEQAMARRKAEQLKAAETQNAADEAAAKKVADESALKLLEGETVEQGLIRRRREQEEKAPGVAPPATP